MKWKIFNVEILYLSFSWKHHNAFQGLEDSMEDQKWNTDQGF